MQNQHDETDEGKKNTEIDTGAMTLSTEMNDKEQRESWAGGRDSKREGNLRRSKRKQQLSYQHKRDFEGHQQLGGRILSLAWLKISESTEVHQREQDESQHMLGCGGRMLTVKLPTRKKWKVIKIQKNNTP